MTEIASLYNHLQQQSIHYFLWCKAFHIIAAIAWFAGLFYLPRLFVYHTDAHDAISVERFQIMERRLYYGIMWPAAILTTFFGCCLLWAQPLYLKQGWMHTKLLGIACLWIYHWMCGYYRQCFAQQKNKHASKFYRVFNEIPTLLLILIVCMAVIKP